MASIEKAGRLNTFVTPIKDGGLGLCEMIVDKMITNKIYTPKEVYSAIQSSGASASIKALSEEEIDRIMTWMIGRNISGSDIIAGGTGHITIDPYTKEEYVSEQK